MWGGSFSVWVRVASNETEAEINTSFIQWPKNGEAGTKFTDQLLAHPARDLILKSKDKGKRSEANDGEAYALVYWGRGQCFFKGVRCHALFILFWSLMSGHGCW